MKACAQVFQRILNGLVQLAFNVIDDYTLEFALILLRLIEIMQVGSIKPASRQKGSNKTKDRKLLHHTLPYRSADGCESRLKGRLIRLSIDCAFQWENALSFGMSRL